MMLEKPPLKPKDAQDVDDADIANDRQKDIERRLALLVEEGSSSIETQTDPMSTMKKTESTEEKLLQGMDDLLVLNRKEDERENPRPERLPEEEVTEKNVSSGNLESDLPQALKQGTHISTKKNALLARIMAAQQKAKLVQTTQPEDQPSNTDPDSTTVQEENDMLKVHATGHNNNVLDKGTELVSPPAFDGIEELQKSKQEETFPPAAPPPFESVQADILQFTCAPSAPPVEESSVIFDHADHLDDVTPIMPSPSCLDKDTQEKETDLFVSFQLEGLSEEEKIQMMEEQRKIMEEIKQHTVENTTSVVAARANAFDLRSNVNAAAAAGNGSAAQVTCGVSLDEHSTFQSSEERTVNIGSGQQVALYGEGRTRDAMKDGTAILVECPNCQSWMQVAATATLMYCPLCSTVSPVMEQGEMMSKEELTQIENDRKLAEELQNMESTQGESSEESQQYQITNSEENNKSWWDSISETFLPSSGSEQSEKNYAAVSVSHPPGYSLQEVKTGLGMTAEETADSSNYERERFLGHSNRSTENFRVAERKPLFSCVVDGISNTANVLGTTLGSSADEDNNNVHGIDTTSLLAVPESTGRDN